MSTSSRFKYLLAYIVPFVVWFSLYSESYLSFSSIFLLFIVLPFIELFTNGSSQNIEKWQEEIVKKDRVYDWILYGLVPMQYGLLIYFLIKISDPSLNILYKLGCITAFGQSCGILGINAAHELGHRTTKYERFMSKALLLTTLYMHFYIEHNRGHHKNVATDQDPASSKRNESLYVFYIRSIAGSWLSAWHLEQERLTKQGSGIWSFKNEMLVFLFIQLVLVLTILVFFGLNTLLAFFVSAITGILLLETVNYIEHYGLRRNTKGQYLERTGPEHSWNSNHPLGRIILLELTRHSDHHYMASRKFQVLRHFDASPQMPTGYPGMMMLSLIPPLWFSVMNKRIDDFQKTIS